MPGRGRPPFPPQVRDRFFVELDSCGRVATAAAVAGVSQTLARIWVREAGIVPRFTGGRPASPLVKARFFDELDAGVSPSEAARVVGVAEATGHKWAAMGRPAGLAEAVRQAHRVSPSSTTPLPITPPPAGTARADAVTWLERCRIEELVDTGCRQARIARLLGRSPATISRELRRGQTRSGRYRAKSAQDAAEQARRRPKVRKLEHNHRLRGEVVTRLRRKESPEQVAGRLVLDFPDDPEMRVSHETIYQAIYVQGRGSLRTEVKDALRTKRVYRKPRGRSSSENARGKIAGMINISERPAEAADRAVPGHWEGDLIIGAGGQSAIGTLVERTTGFVMLLHLPGDRTAATVAAAMTAKIVELPESLRRSITWDQGKEMAKHAEFTIATGVPVYFCDPHSPWQRGSNENTNGLLRQYFPKGTDLSFHGPGILDNVADELNSRPRKRFGWHTPAEELNRLLSDPTTFIAATA